MQSCASSGAGFKGTCTASRRRTALGTIQETAYIPGSPQGISEPERSQSCPLLCKMSCKNRIGKKGRNWASIYNDVIIDLLVTGEMLWAIFPVSGKNQASCWPPCAQGTLGSAPQPGAPSSLDGWHLFASSFPTDRAASPQPQVSVAFKNTALSGLGRACSVGGWPVSHKGPMLGLMLLLLS